MSKHFSMNVIASVQDYVDKLVSDPRIKGMKALILDSDTVKMLVLFWMHICSLDQLTQLFDTEIHCEHGLHTVTDSRERR